LFCATKEIDLETETEIVKEIEVEMDPKENDP
jgi:hypothetical protein